jgi:2'-5' RNA ligase
VGWRVSDDLPYARDVTHAPLRTALLVAVPEAEPVVGRWRSLFDPSALHGVPPHVTLIFPYLSSDRCDARVLAQLRDIFRRTARFDFQLAGAGEFPGILYLTPTPHEPFRDLIQTLVDQFPDAPPYGGIHPTIIPHLTVAHSCDDATRALMIESVSASLPIQCLAHEAQLMRENIDGDWELNERFPLGG